jgi:hypothetical protein
MIRSAAVLGAGGLQSSGADSEAVVKPGANRPTPLRLMTWTGLLLSRKRPGSELSPLVASRRPDRTVRFERERVLVAGGDRDYGLQVRLSRLGETAKHGGRGASGAPALRRAERRRRSVP